MRTTIRGHASRACAKTHLRPLCAMLAGLAALGGGCTSGAGTVLPGRDAGTQSDAGDGTGARDAGPPQDGGRCVARCGADCCTASEECVGDRCEPACAGARCGANDAECCGLGELCLAGECRTPGERCVDASDCDSGDTCDPLLRRCVPLPGGDVCRVAPGTAIEPVLEWQWTSGSLAQVANLPLVVQLDDDDGSGAVDEQDVPDVVVIAGDGIGRAARLVALDGRTGVEHWSSDPSVYLCATSAPAAADVDGDGAIEILALVTQGGPCHPTLGSASPRKRLAAFARDGSLRWLHEPFPPEESTPLGDLITYEGSVQVADLDGDGEAEIVVANAVISAHGRLVWQDARIITGRFSPHAAIDDLDGDGRQEVVYSDLAFRADGSVLWQNGAVPYGTAAIAHFVDATPGAQVFVANTRSWAVLDGATGATLIGPVVHDAGAEDGFYAVVPTVGDVDGDGSPEVGLTSEGSMVMIDLQMAAPHQRWSVPFDASGIASISPVLFDFTGDGTVELLVHDETGCSVPVLDGATGTRIVELPGANGAGFSSPVVADVDNDGNAELVVVSERLPSCPGVEPGVRVFRDRNDAWVPTLRVWNQHSYHVGCVGEDGALPRTPPSSWREHNTWRQSRLPDPDDVSLAPNLVIGAVRVDVEACPSRLVLRARVQNAGAWGVAAGIPVAFYGRDESGSQVLLGVARTRGPLFAGGAEWVSLMLDAPPLDDEGQLEFVAVADDDGGGASRDRECREDDNASASGAAFCGLI